MAKTLGEQLTEGIGLFSEATKNYNGVTKEHNDAREAMIKDVEAFKKTTEAQLEKRRTKFKGFLVNCFHQAKAQIYGAKNDFVGAKTTINSSGGHYLHLKFSGISNTSSVMINLVVHGHEFGSNKNIHIAGSAYSLGTYGAIYSSNFSNNSHSAVFYKTKTGTYLRITLNSSYCLSLNIDAYDTNIARSNLGKIEATFSKSKEL